MSRPPYFRPYGAQAFTRAVSASARILVPRFWRIYLALWLIRRWRLPATPILILPVAVSLKRFLTPLLVLSLGIFVSLFCSRMCETISNRHGSPHWPGRSLFPRSWKARAYTGRVLERQGSPSRTGWRRWSRRRSAGSLRRVAAQSSDGGSCRPGD